MGAPTAQRVGYCSRVGLLFTSLGWTVARHALVVGTASEEECVLQDQLASEWRRLLVRRLRDTRGCTGLKVTPVGRTETWQAFRA